MKKAYFFSFMPVICWQKVKHFLLSRTVSYWKLWVPVDWITPCSHPQNLISEARDLTDQALQLLQTATGILNTSRQHVSTGENNYQVHVRRTDYDTCICGQTESQVKENTKDAIPNEVVFAMYKKSLQIQENLKMRIYWSRKTPKRSILWSCCTCNQKGTRTVPIDDSIMATFFTNVNFLSFFS